VQPSVSRGLRGGKSCLGILLQIAAEAEAEAEASPTGLGGPSMFCLPM
jgi:hypothetical protein